MEGSAQAHGVGIITKATNGRRRGRGKGRGGGHRYDWSGIEGDVTQGGTNATAIAKTDGAE